MFHDFSTQTLQFYHGFPSLPSVDDSHPLRLHPRISVRLGFRDLRRIKGSLDESMVVCLWLLGVVCLWGTPKSSTLMEVSIINHPFWGIPIYACGNPMVASSLRKKWSNWGANDWGSRPPHKTTFIHFRSWSFNAVQIHRQYIRKNRQIDR